MATGDTNDFISRLRGALPRGWFGTAPILDALLSGLATAWAEMYALYQYVALQTRIRTATGLWLDIAASDFFGTNLPRLANELDAQYRARILAALFVEQGTRNAIYYTLQRLTGRAPLIIEPARPADTGAYGGNEAITIVGTPAIYKTDWQGRQLQYATPRTNKLLYSEQIDQASWTKQNVSITPNAAVAPDGTMSMDLIAITTATDPWIQESIAITPNSVNVMSMYVKQGTAARVELRVPYIGGTTIDKRAIFDFSTGTFVSVDSTVVALPPVNIGNGIWRISAAFTDTLSNTTAFVRCAPTNSLNGYSVGDSVYAWGLQFELNSNLPTSYIPTTTAPVTVTDYALSGSNIVMANAPVSGAVLDWSGTEYSALLNNNINIGTSVFGIGDGITTSWNISRRYGYNGYGMAGRYGSTAMPYQALVQAFLPAQAGIPLVAGYGVSMGAYGTPSQAEYATFANAQNNVALTAICNAIDAAKPAGTIVWVGPSN